MPITPVLTINFKLQDLGGGVDAAASIIVTLCGYGSVIPKIAGTSIIADTVIVPAVDGAGSGSFTPWGNDVISPGPNITYYMVQVKNAKGGTIQANAYQFTGSGTFDLSNVGTINPNPPAPPPPQAVLLNPTGPQTISNFPLTAFLSLCTVQDNLKFFGSLAGTTTLKAAATASGTLVFPAISGTDNLVSLTSTDTLSNKTISGLGGAGLTFAGQTSGSTLVKASATASGTLTLPAGTGTLLLSPIVGTGLPFAGATSGQTVLQATAIASGTLTLPAATDTLVGKATTDVLTNKTLGGTTPYNRLRANQGGALVTGDVGGLSGWGTTAAVAAVTGRDSAGTIDISSSGTGQTANPKYTLTFHDGTFTNPPVVVVTRIDAQNVAFTIVVETVTATAVTFRFQGLTPAAGVDYLVGFIAIGT